MIFEIVCTVLSTSFVVDTTDFLFFKAIAARILWQKFDPMCKEQQIIFKV